MNSRPFIIGVICGAFVGVTAGWFLGGGRDEPVPIFSKHETSSAIVRDVVRIAPAASNDTQESTAAASQEKNNPQPSSGSRVDPVTPWPENLREELELEPKDDSWAYYMEQTLLQFLSTHSSVEQFDISSIECRTTKCQIEVFGYDESTIPVWQQVMYDIRQQPWSEFVQYGSSSGIVEGRLTIVGTFHQKSE